MYAVRNIKLCTKDCLCLFVCPNGAADTENGVIDKNKCIGCKKCMEACPSHAITMVPREYPNEQEKNPKIIEHMKRLAKSKIEQQEIALNIMKEENNLTSQIFNKAIAKSNLIMAEDIYREAGFMIPQSDNVKTFLKNLSKNSAADFPNEKVKELLKLIDNKND
ncbi:MAG: 4Fe-4S binding protein [Bacilli bacterium]